MRNESITVIKALVWKDAKNMLPYLAFCIVVTIWAILLIIYSGPIIGNSRTAFDGLVAYAPFIIAMFSAAVMITTLSEETTGNTLESLLCTPLDLKEILISKILFITVFPYLISMILILPLLAVLGKPIVSVIVLYQMIVDLPIALLIVTSATAVWLWIPGKLHWILPLFGSVCVLVSLFFYSNYGALYGISVSLPISPIFTTIFLVISVSIIYALNEKIGTIEKSDVI